MGKPEGKRPLGRLRHRTEDNIKMDLQEVVGEGTDWIDLAQNRDRTQTRLNAIMKFQVPNNAGNFLTSSGPVNFSRTLLHGAG